MANELRVYANFLGGRLSADAASGATSLSSAAFASLPVIDTTNHMLIALDPDGLTGEPLVLRVTAHTAAATTVTVDATGSEGTTARALKAGCDWVHSLVLSDVVMPFVMVVRSAALNIATGGTTIAWDAESEDVWGFHDNATNNDRLTVPAGYGGLYRAGGAVITTPLGTAGKVASIYLAKNAASIVGGEFAIAQDAAVAVSLLVDTPVRLVAGDYVTLGVYIDNAAALAMNTSKSAFWLHRIAA